MCTQGDPGVNGTDGDTGLPGLPGNPGIDGPPGSKGMRGAPGDVGQQGPTVRRMLEICPSILSTPLPPFPPIRVILALPAPQEGLVTQAAEVHLEPRSEYCKYIDHTSAFFTPCVLPSPHLLPSPSPLTFSTHTFLPHLPLSSFLPPSLSLFSLPPFSLLLSSLLRVKKVVKGTEA